MVLENAAREKLRSGHPVVGAWVLSMSPRVAERLSMSGLDWIGIDMEHTPIDTRRVEEVIRAIERGDATPIVRLPSVTHASIGACKHVLDAGAQGIIIPGVEAPKDIEQVLTAAWFPPAGRRGAAGTTRANRYGEDFEGYIEKANVELLIVIQIESPTAVDDIDTLLEFDGIDVAFIGENDLSTAYGHPGKKDHDLVRSAVDTVLDSANEHGIYPGIAARSPENLSHRIERGFQFFLLGADVTFMHDGVAPFLRKR